MSQAPIRSPKFDLLLCSIVLLILWFVPSPAGLSDASWHYLAIFATTIFALLLGPLPLGPLVLLGLMTAVLSGTLDFKSSLSGFADTTVWLVVAAFLLAGAVRRTGLGKRIALILVSKLGKSTLGLGYALVGSELILGPVVPSNTARGGGILAPIVRALSEALGSTPHENPRKAGEYLTLVGAHANLIAAAMFLTGMAANPLIAKAAKQIMDVEFTWGLWAMGALVPGLLGLLLLPLFFYVLAPPELKLSGAAQTEARHELSVMGRWNRAQISMGILLGIMVVLWASSPIHHMGSAQVALMGVLTLVLLRIQTWKELIEDAAAWDSLIWLGGLLTLANGLKDVGVIEWFQLNVQVRIQSMGLTGIMVIILLALIYFVSMYAFSMLTAHISAMVGAFLAVGLALNAPPMMSIMLLAAFSNLCGCLTNYSSGPIIIYFGLGYVPTARWFKFGALTGLFHIAIWLGPGLLWWKVLGWL